MTTPSPGPTPFLHQIFEAVARRYPDRVAVEVPPGTGRPHRSRTTYAELDRLADGVAAAVRPGAAADALVAILLPRETPLLYAAQLGVLKAGAAYVCLDPATPDPYLRRVLDDADPVALVTDEAGQARAARLGGPLPPLVDPSVAPTGGLSPSAVPPSLAYAIYTSGTTGEPKGVLIEHRGVVNLVIENVGYFGLTPADRVAQCSSPAYDSSVEEAWLAFAVGATLVPLDDETVRLGPDLVPWLREERITVLCPPPTLLRATGCMDPHRALPDLRLLYVGGEPLPTDLADRWAVGRRMENGYGPTECTVTVLRGPVRPGEPVTIGTPVPGHKAWVVDDGLREVPDGEAGELCVAGVGLARGYHRRPDRTAEKFPRHPGYGRVYRTGDLVRRDPHGRFEYLGRIDDQVKVRGYRIELGAVETRLASCPGVRAAACRVQVTPAGQVLAAHVVPDTAGRPPVIDALKDSLRRSLPAYMVPGRFGFLDRLPTTVGGKVDRKALPDLPPPAAEQGGVAPRDDEEALVARSFAQALRLTSGVSVHDDFFLDLGGDSLSAVGVILALRAAAGGTTVTVRDLYETRTAAALADRLRDRQPRPATPIQERGPREAGRPLICTAVQSLWLLSGVVVSGAVSWLVGFDLLPAALERVGLGGTVLLAPFVMLLSSVLYAVAAVALTVAAKRILVGRYQPGRAVVWGGFYTRHWVVAHTARLIPWWLIEGTVFQAAVLRALGARVGHRVHIHRGVDLTGGGWDLLAIGDDVTLAQDAEPRVIELRDGELILGPVTIGDGATVDVRAGLSPHSTVERNGYLAPLSWLPGGARLPEGERWDGIPASAAGTAPLRPELTRRGSLPPTVHGALMVLGRQAIGLMGWLPFVVAGLVADVVLPDATGRLLGWLSHPGVSAAGAAAVLAGLVAWVPLSLVARGLAARLVGRARPGVVGQYSLDAIRVRIKTGLVDSANRWLSGSLFWPWWLRLAGMRIGRGCEISTLIDVVPETVTVGDGCFFADGIYFCGPRRHRGTVTIAETTVGRDTFVGNHAVIPPGCRWPDGLFVGVATVADPDQVRSGSAWFGHPPMELPRREVATADPRLTHRPGPVRYFNRLFWESLRFTLPVLPATVGYAWYWCLAAAGQAYPSAVVLSAAVLTLTASASLCLAVVALKWTLLGRVRPGQHPLWSCWCSRWDFVYVAWQQWAARPLSALEGTLLLNAFLRLTGMRIGRRVVLGAGSAQVVDPDMLAIEDGATVDGHFQAHSFEDRILKIDRVRVGRGATVGFNAVVFYGADIGDRAAVAPHGVVMKREILVPGGEYVGCPTRPAAPAPPTRGAAVSSSPPPRPGWCSVPATR